MLHNFMFSENENFTFEEVVASYSFASIGQPFTSTNIGQWMKLHNLLIEDDGEWENSYNWTFISIGENNSLIFNDYALDLLNKIYLRYRDHYCVRLQMPYENAEKTKAFKDLFEKILKLLDYSYEKYSTLMNLYASQKSHLTDRLGRSRSGSRSVSEASQHAENSASIFNDTPQNVDVVATLDQNQYATELNKGSVAGSRNTSGNDSYSETEQWDNATIMSRLAEIEKEFAMIWKKWLNEFDTLFIEEVNLV